MDDTQDPVVDPATEGTGTEWESTPAGTEGVEDTEPTTAPDGISEEPAFPDEPAAE